MNPFGALLTLAFCIAVSVASRRWAVVVIILGVCYITQGQVVDVFAFHFTSIRIILLVGLIRIIARGEYKYLQFSNIDRDLLIYTLVLCVVTIVRIGTIDAFIYQLGILYNVLFSYFVFRVLLRDENDVIDVFASFAYFLVPLALLMIWESNTGRSAFLNFGGFVDEQSVVRDGHVRCQGPFRQAITAGAFGATLGLYYAGLLFATRKTHGKFWIGLVASIVILLAAHSSGPILGFAIGIISLLIWRLRHHMRIIRWGMLVSLVGLHFIMKDPVWFIVARIGDIVGGGGYHRAYLIDRFINDFNSWWLLGSDNTSSWFPYLLYTGKADITNQFVSDGLNGGLVGLLLSIGLIIRCYKEIGRKLKCTTELNQYHERMLWCIASILTGSIGILFSVTYFDQMHVVWYLFLACITAVTSTSLIFPSAIEDTGNSS